jgi:hypothetical protein
MGQLRDEIGSHSGSATSAEYMMFRTGGLDCHPGVGNYSKTARRMVRVDAYFDHLSHIDAVST